MKVPSFSTTLATQRYDAEVEARQREYDLAFTKRKKMPKQHLDVRGAARHSHLDKEVTFILDRPLTDEEMGTVRERFETMMNTKPRRKKK